LDKKAVPERIQSSCTSTQLSKDLASILDGPDRNTQLDMYKELKEKLGGVGASKKTAELIYQRTNA
jgi:lipid-A-disaccharide synthase